MFSLLIDKIEDIINKTEVCDKNKNDKLEKVCNNLLWYLDRSGYIIILEYFASNENDIINNIIIKFSEDSGLLNNLMIHLIRENNIEKIKYIHKKTNEIIDYDYLEYALEKKNIEIASYLIENGLNDVTKMKLSERDNKTFTSIIEKLNSESLHKALNLINELKEENILLKKEINELKKEFKILKDDMTKK